METFIVRVWAPSPTLAAEVSSEELRGNVEHVASKQSLAFRSTDDLIEILRRARDSEPPGPATKPFKET